MNTRKMLSIALILAAVLLLAGGAVLAQTGGDYNLTWHTVDGGGGTVSGGGYTLAGTAGQPEPGPALTGGDLCHDVGYTESAMTGSVFQLCAMDEAIGYARRITRGIEVNDDTLAVSVIHDVGPNGHYLKEKHTRRHYKSEFWYPNLLDRQDFETWEMTGGLTMKDRTIARVRDILATHSPSPIKPETEKVIEKVLAQAEERVKEK